jgi:tetratricopeptide (TPR) repeat protein
VKAAEFLTRALLGMNKPDSAWLVIQDSEIKRKTFNITDDSASGHFLMGKILAEFRQYHAAIPRLKLALAGNLEAINRQKTTEIETVMADCYMGLGQNETALNYYLRALQITPDTSSMAYIHYKLSDIFEKKDRLQQPCITSRWVQAVFVSFSTPTRTGQQEVLNRRQHSNGRPARRCCFMNNKKPGNTGSPV